MADGKALSKEEITDIVVDISGRIGFAVPQTRELAIQLLDNVNDHMTASAIRSLDLGDVDLACEFLHFGERGGWVAGGSPEADAHEQEKSALFGRLQALQAAKKP